jgi:hypothetical protein
VGVVGGIAALIAVFVALAATLAVYPAVWRAFRHEWRRIPVESRFRVWTGVGLAALACILVGFLLMVQPRGPHTFLWVLLVGGVGFMVLALAGVTPRRSWIFVGGGGIGRGTSRATDCRFGIGAAVSEAPPRAGRDFVSPAFVAM